LTNLYNVSIDIPTGKVSKADWLDDKTDLIPSPGTVTKNVSIIYDGRAGRIDVEGFVSEGHSESVALQAREYVLNIARQCLAED
jgi:hypothetical protein